MNKWLKILPILSLLALIGCSSTPAGWSVSCGMPSGSYETDETKTVYTMTLDGDERDACHKGGKLSRHKQRAEIYSKVSLEKLYRFEYEFKYSGSGGATILQLHPGRPSNVQVGIWSECDQLSMIAGYNQVRFNIPGQIELYPVSDTQYKDKWHKVEFMFRASNDQPLYKLKFNGEEIYDSSQSTSPIDLCYYNVKPSLKLGLYRGKRDTTESISFKNLKLTKLD